MCLVCAKVSHSPTRLYHQIVYTANIDGVRSWAVKRDITVYIICKRLKIIILFINLYPSYLSTDMGSIEELQNTIADLQKQLKDEKQKVEELKGTAKRHKIEKMSAEVVDSNPYR